MITDPDAPMHYTQDAAQDKIKVALIERLSDTEKHARIIQGDAYQPLTVLLRDVRRYLEALVAPAHDKAEDRKTFVVPDGYVAVRDAEGRATGEVVPAPDELCEDEGCPHFGTPHVCNPATREVAPAPDNGLVEALELLEHLSGWIGPEYVSEKERAIQASHAVIGRLLAALAALEAKP